MKVFLITTLLTLTFQSASAFQIQANCQFNQSQGVCQVFNQWTTPIYCSLKAQGQTNYGVWANAFINATIYPGDYAYVYVNANNPYMDPLVFVQGSANCQF
jgi:hypothetical protein